VVFPDYRRSPEARYPSAIEEAYAAAEWIVEHGAERGLDPARVVVAGDSVGGNMTAAVTLMAKDRAGPEFRAQVLLYPVTDASFDTQSYHEFAEGYHLRRDMMQWFWDQYTTDPDERAQITASPLRATTDQLAGLPPALVITGEADVLRDEGEAYGRKLRQAGVDVAATRHEGIVHDFLMLDAMRDSHAARAATSQIVAYIREHLTGPSRSMPGRPRGVASSRIMIRVSEAATMMYLAMHDHAAAMEPVDRAVDHVRGGSAGQLIVEYGDYECPYSRRAFREIERVEGQLGQGVRFAFRHFPLTEIHPHALAAAAAAEAAALQDRFWDMHELLFHRQAALEDDDLRRYAAELGLDVARFDAERSGDAVLRRIGRDVESGLGTGQVQGTPTLFIDGVVHRGGYEAAVLMEALGRR
jgi:2-hydroxychromene-2-carboxylate isomerase/dienelactone hydrolase